MLLRGCLSVLILTAAAFQAAAESGGERAATTDWLKAVRAYADCLLEHGRDTYGSECSPLFAEALDRHTLKLLDAHELTDERAYLARAEALAAQAVKVFTGDDCPLPKATHVHDHYEAITGADTLMMSLLSLWARQQTPPRELGLLFTDR